MVPSVSVSTTVRGFWHGDPLNALHWACLRSFRKNHHQFELFVYEDLEVPNGVQLRDANEVVPKENLFFLENSHSSKKDVAPFTDYFRLKFLNDFGGWWCDIDTICLSANFPAGERVWARQAPDYRPDSISNGQLYFKKGDWVVRKLFAACEEAMPNTKRRESLGPELISSVIAELELPLDMGASAEEFYPVRYIENFKLWLPEFYDEVKEKVESAVFLPIYQSFPARLGFSYRILPPDGSFLNEFIRNEAPELSGMTHDADEFRRAVRKWFRRNSAGSISRLSAVSKGDILGWLNG
jgi:hypothetical protein